MTLCPSSLVYHSLRYRLETVQVAPRFRVAWDDENPDYQFKCRTQQPGWFDVPRPDNPPAVMPFYSIQDERDRQRVNLEKDPSWRWWDSLVILNGGDEGKVNYLTGSGRAQFNDTGWPRMAYISMSGNYLQGYRVGEWFRFKTLKPTDWLKARGMTIESHPCFVHRFTCVSWENNQTVHIESTGTPRGQVYYFLVTNEGFAYIPFRHVVEEH